MRDIMWAVLAVTACVGTEESSEALVAEDPGQGALEVLISTADGLIGDIADLIVGEDGTLYAVDRQSSRLHVVSPSGQVHTLGRPGAGPGEFSQPTTLEARGDTLLVVDWGNGRLQGISRSGEHLFTRPLPAGYPPSIGAGARFVRPTLGMDTMLAVIHAADLSVVAPIGRIVGLPYNRINVRHMKQEIREGKVPEIILNTADAVVAPDSSTWLYVRARGSVQRFDPTGRELFIVVLEEFEHEEIFDKFVEENAAKPLGSFADLSYIADATLVGEDLWVLLGSSLAGPAAIRVIHPDGRMGKRIEFPEVTGASQVAVDAVRGFAYFVKGDLAELVRASVRGPAG